MQNIWKDVVGYEGLYRVSDKGDIFSSHSKQNALKNKNGLLSQCLLSKRYLYVNLSKDACKYPTLIHRIVAIAFIENPENKPCVNHINGIKTDNRVENLEWCTYAENANHNFRVLGYISPSSLNKKQVFEILANTDARYSNALSEKFGVTRQAIKDARCGKSYKIWREEYVNKYGPVLLKNKKIP